MTAAVLETPEMARGGSLLGRLEAILGLCIEIPAAALVVGEVLVLLAGVVMRFVFNHPLPWSALDYDPSTGSYVVDYTQEQLKAAPAGSIDELTRDDGLAYRDRVFDYYKVQVTMPPRRS